MRVRPLLMPGDIATACNAIGVFLFGRRRQLIRQERRVTSCFWHPSQRSYDLLLRSLLLSDSSRKSPSTFDFGSQLINICGRDIVAFDLVTDSIVEVAVFVALYVSYTDAALWKEADFLLHEP